MRYRVALLVLAALAATACASTPGPCPVPKPLECPPVPLPLCQTSPPAAGYPFKNLVLEGGGVKGIAYAGAFAELQEKHILQNIQGVAGTSAGAITATLIALGYTPEEIQSLMLQIDFQRFEDGGFIGGIHRLFERFGWYKGDYLLHLMRCEIGNKTGAPNATFEYLKDHQFRDLHVFATDVSTGQSKEFSAALTPHVEVARAVRMSMSIPLFFASIDFQNDVFVDGGVLLNYPIDTFDPTGPPPSINHATLGLTLTSGPPPRAHVNDLPDYSKALFATLLNTQVVDLQTNPADLERTVLIDDLKIGTTDFQLTKAQKCALVAEGRACTCQYLKDWQSWQPPGRSPAADIGPLGRATRINIKDICGSAWTKP
ncbi:MAG TPA: patatin-like phospholipase family protein [Thermoanaerobaculia bacterium]|jgi:NTE family protein